MSRSAFLIGRMALAAMAGSMLLAGCSQSNSPSADTATQAIPDGGYSASAAKAAGLRPVTDNFAVSPQIHIKDLAKIKAAGFTRIIDNRPDGEGGASQPPSARLRREAEKLGMKFVYLPFAGAIPEHVWDGETQALEASREPTLAYCRSGTRAITIWAMAQAKSGRMTPDSIVKAAANAGYPLQGRRQLLEKLASEAKGQEKEIR